MYADPVPNKNVKIRTHNNKIDEFKMYSTKKVFFRSS